MKRRTGRNIGDPDHAPQRVTKLMSRRGMCSRREAERLIDAGAVMVDGVAVRQQGVKAAPDARIEVIGRGARWLAQQVTVLLNKPIGVVSTQPEGQQIPAWHLLTRATLHGGGDPDTIERAVAEPWYLSVAGRLDKESRGLLLMTQDGVLARRATGGGMKKTYRVRVDVEPDRDQLAALRGRLVLDGRPLQTMRISRCGERHLRFVLTEGRKHQIRRVCELVGLRVEDLERTAIGPWELGDLPEGRWRLLDPQP